MKRHPVRGFFGGLLLGIGLALVLVQLSLVPLGEFTVVAVIGICVVLGVAAAWLLPPRERAAVVAAPAPAVAAPPPVAPPPVAEPEPEPWRGHADHDSPTRSWDRPADPIREHPEDPRREQ